MEPSQLGERNPVVVIGVGMPYRVRLDLAHDLGPAFPFRKLLELRFGVDLSIAEEGSKAESQKET